MCVVAAIFGLALIGLGLSALRYTDRLSRVRWLFMLPRSEEGRAGAIALMSIFYVIVGGIFVVAGVVHLL